MNEKKIQDVADKRAERARDAHTDGVAGAMLAPALADSPELDDEARRSAEKVARENAERMAEENAGTDREQAARGHVPAAAKNGFPDAYPEPTVLKRDDDAQTGAVADNAPAPKPIKTTAAKKNTGTRAE